MEPWYSWPEASRVGFPYYECSTKLAGEWEPFGHTHQELSLFNLGLEEIIKAGGLALPLKYPIVC